MRCSRAFMLLALLLASSPGVSVGQMKFRRPTLWLEEHSDSVRLLATDWPNKRIASASRKEVCLWSFPTGKLLAKIKEERVIGSLTFIDNGKQLIITTYPASTLHEKAVPAIMYWWNV